MLYRQFLFLFTRRVGSGEWIGTFRGFKAKNLLFLNLWNSFFFFFSERVGSILDQSASLYLTLLHFICSHLELDPKDNTYRSCFINTVLTCAQTPQIWSNTVCARVSREYISWPGSLADALCRLPLKIVCFKAYRIFVWWITFQATNVA